MKVDIAREACIKILYNIEEKKSYSNLELDEYINKNREKLSKKDIAFISEIVYGTVMWKLTIDYLIQKYSKVKVNKISKWVMQILRTSIYQIIFLDKVPKSAAVNEAVKLSKKYAYKSSGFINAILRKIDKNDYNELNNIEDINNKISVMYSMPLWIVEKLIDEYGVSKAQEICENSTLKPKTTIRINTLKISKQEFIKKLKELDIEYEETGLDSFMHIKVQNINSLDMFNKGYFTVQDLSAGNVAIVLNPKENEYILDACAAPGGKTTHIAEIMKNKGRIEAWDIYEHRLEKIKENYERLGIKIISVEKNDATKFNEKYINKFDKILLDVPCLGLGVIKRKPDIKWHRNKDDIFEIAEVQKNILETCSRYLKKGGMLVYSTCSILKEENKNIIEEFKKNEEFEIMYNGERKEEYMIYPDTERDGFYICKLIKK